MEKEMDKLIKAEEFISGVRCSQSIGQAHIAVTLATIRSDRLFLAVAKSWKDYIKQNRSGIGYRNSMRLARVGEIYLTFKDQLEENGIKLSENMSKMELFDIGIAAKDPVFFDKFVSLSYRELKSWIKEYKINGYTSNHGGLLEAPVTEKGASLYIGDEKVRGINLNEVRKEAGAGKRAVVIWVDDDCEARRVRRYADKGRGK